VTEYNKKYENKGLREYQNNRTTDFIPLFSIYESKIVNETKRFTKNSKKIVTKNINIVN